MIAKQYLANKVLKKYYHARNFLSMIRTRITEVSVSDQHVSKHCMTGKGILEQYPSNPMESPSYSASDLLTLCKQGRSNIPNPMMIPK